MDKTKERKAERRSQFSLGALFRTRGVEQCLTVEDVFRGLARHSRGDWGDVCEEDRLANEQALIEGNRLFSVYHAPEGTKYWIITEWDRSMTTVLLPEEY